MHYAISNAWKWRALGFICVAMALSLIVQSGQLLGAGYYYYMQPNEQRHMFPITRGHVIALYPESITPLLIAAKTHLHISNMSVFHAINGSEAAGMDGLQISLYTQYLMLSGRHDHMQLSTPSMLGCLLSHVKIWQAVQPHEMVAVFEEDAYIDRISAQRMAALSRDMASVGSWDVLLLESGHSLIASGRWRHIGEYAATCSSLNHTIMPFPCTWFGTRGYLITYSGAQHLLRHAYPVSVQVCAKVVFFFSQFPNF